MNDIVALINQEYLDRLQESTDFEAVVREFVPDLKRTTGAEMVGHCPFHKERTASFAINIQKKVYLCRGGCGANGNSIDFVMNKTGTTFRGAVERLAKLAGMPLPGEINDARASSQYLEQQEVLGLLDRAAGLYRDALKASPEARAYLAKRGVNDAMIERFGIGFAPAGGVLLRNSMKDVPVPLMQKAGLLRVSEFNPGECQDWMNYRVVFPIRNSSGNAIAFGGRSLSRNPQRKYMNTPESPVFKKGSELYGLYEGGNEIRKRKVAVITEGYLDVVVPSGNDVKNIVCAMGASLSPAAVSRLFAAAEHLVFCFDADTAGRRAAIRMLPILAPLLDERHRASFALLPDGMDPDDFVLKHGAPAFEEFIGKALPLSKYLISEFSSRQDMTSAEGKALFAAETMEIVRQVRAPTYRKLLTNAVREVIGADTPLPEEELDTPPRLPPNADPRRSNFTPGIPAPAPQAVRQDGGDNKPKLIISLLSIALRDPPAFNYFDPEWLRYATLSEGEANAIRAVAAATQSAADGEQLKALLVGTPAEELLQQAEKYKSGTADPIKQLSDLIDFLTLYHQRVLNMERRSQGVTKAPAPTP